MFSRDSNCTCPTIEESLRGDLEGQPVDPHRCAHHFPDVHEQRRLDADKQRLQDEADRLLETLADAGHEGAQRQLDRRAAADVDPLEAALARAVGRPHLHVVHGGSSLAINASAADISKRHRWLSNYDAKFPDAPIPPIDGNDAA